MRKQVSFNQFLGIIPIEIAQNHEFSFTGFTMNYHCDSGFLAINLPGNFEVEIRKASFTIYTDLFWFSMYFKHPDFHFGFFDR